MKRETSRQIAARLVRLARGAESYESFSRCGISSRQLERLEKQQTKCAPYATTIVRIATAGKLNPNEWLSLFGYDQMSRFEIANLTAEIRGPVTLPKKTQTALRVAAVERRLNLRLRELEQRVAELEGAPKRRHA